MVKMNLSISWKKAPQNPQQWGFGLLIGCNFLTVSGGS